MRAAEHFLSELGALERKNIESLNQDLERRLSDSFLRLVSPLLGRVYGQELFSYWTSTYSNPINFLKLGYIAAFISGEYDDESMDLNLDDFEVIRDTLNEGAEELDLTVLSTLMGELVSRGYLT